MIEKALQEAGEQTPNPPEPALKSKQTDPKKANKPQKDEKARKKNEEAAALLEKRKKYDPRKALKKGKVTKKKVASPKQ